MRRRIGSKLNKSAIEINSSLEIIELKEKLLWLLRMALEAVVDFCCFIRGETRR